MRETLRESGGGYSRREFLKTGAAAGAAALAVGLSATTARAADPVRVGLVGCGSRGTAAARDLMRAAEGVTVVAVADAFADVAARAGERLGVPAGKRFVGLSAYKEVLALDDVDLVVLAGVPAFRPAQFAAAVEAGKHVHLEPPAAICPAGYRMVLEAAKKAGEKKLSVSAGLQRRHDPATVETMKRVADGAIGRIVTGQCYWNQGGVYAYPRRIGQSDIEWQLRNWRYFTWLGGDVVVERHIHNLDVMNWAFASTPERVHALGGRQYRTSGAYGNVFDHFGSEVWYPNDVHVISMCRQIDGTTLRIGERLVGTKGSTDCRGTIEGENAWRYEGADGNAYVAGGGALVKSIRDGSPLSEGTVAADAALAGILIRESAYTRMNMKRSWFLAKCQLDLLPTEHLDLDGARHVDPVPVPGKYVLPGAPTGKRR